MGICSAQWPKANKVLRRWPLQRPLVLQCKGISSKVIEIAQKFFKLGTCLRPFSVMPRSVDPEGFDAVRDTVGAGIYSGKVKRDENGNIIIGRQYQNHNPVPGPVYAGGGYTAMANAIHDGPEAVKKYLSDQPDVKAAANEVMTGGATPLHTCGMSRKGQLCTQILIDAGGDIEALDTYGYTPLHRMASNNLDIGAEALLKAKADVNRESGPPYAGETPLQIAMQSGARAVAAVLMKHGGTL